MPRTDVVIEMELGEMDLEGKIPSIFNPLSLVKEDDFSIFFKCSISNLINFEAVKKGIGTKIEQTDSLKNILIEFEYTSGVGEVTKTGYLPVVNIKDINVKGVDLPLISKELYFRIFLSEDSSKVIMFNAYEYDIFVNNSLEQNEYFLLVADAGNIYHQPITGVGLKNYLNSDIVSSGLAQKIQEQFTIDKMFINSATVNPDTGSINIDSVEI